VLDFINNQGCRVLSSRHSAHRYSEVTLNGELLPVKRAFAVVPYISSHLPVAYHARGWVYWSVRHIWLTKLTFINVKFYQDVFRE